MCRQPVVDGAEGQRKRRGYRAATLMRVRIGLGLAVLAAAGLAGCSDVDRVVQPLHFRSDVTMTPAQARADLDRKESDLTAVLGGMWANRDNYIATGCGSGDKGYYYHGGRTRSEAVADPAAASDLVAEWWTKSGYKVARATYGRSHVLTGEAENGTTIYLNFDEDRTWFKTDGPCLPGDWDKIGDDDLAHQRNDIVRTPTPAPTPTE